MKDGGLLLDQSAITALSIDLDDTLWPIMPVIEAANRISWAWFAEHYPKVVSRFKPEDCYRFRRQAGSMHPECVHDLSRLRIVTYELLLQAAGYDPQGAGDAFAVFFAARNDVKPFPDVEPALSRLAKRFRLISLSNGNADLQQIPLGRYFSASVSARITGVKKPDPAMFDAVCQQADAGPRQLLHIGDHPLEDIAGAINYGIPAIWVNRSSEVWRHPGQPLKIVGNLLQVADWLQT